MEGVPPKAVQVHEHFPANTPQPVTCRSNACGRLDPRLPPTGVNSRPFPSGKCRNLTKGTPAGTVGGWGVFLQRMPLPYSCQLFHLHQEPPALHAHSVLRTCRLSFLKRYNQGGIRTKAVARCRRRADKHQRSEGKGLCSQEI